MHFLSLALVKIEVFFLLLLTLFQLILYMFGIFPQKIYSNFFELGVLFIFVGYLLQLEYIYLLQEEIVGEGMHRNFNLKRVMLFVSSFLIFFGFSFFWTNYLLKFIIIFVPFIIKFILNLKKNALILKFLEKFSKSKNFQRKSFFKEKLIISILIYFNIILNCFLYELSLK